MTPPTARSRIALQWLARGVVAVVFSLSVLTAIDFKIGARDFWLLELLHYGPYPVFLFTVFLALALSWLLSRRWQVAAVVALVLVCTVVMGLELNRGDKGDGPLRLMTYNIKAYRAVHKQDGFESIAREVAAHNPDILVMQDADILTMARKANPMTAHSIFDGREVYAFEQFIVVSRYPLQQCRPGDKSIDGMIKYVHCTVLVPGRPIELFSAHFLSPREGLNATRHERLEGLDDWRENFTIRLAQSGTLAKDLATRPRPLIVAGDLNAPESSPVVQRLLDTGLRDAFSAGGVGYGYTHGHSLRFGVSFLRIDHVLVSPELGVANCFAGGSEGSEHRPVIADLLLNRL